MPNAKEVTLLDLLDAITGLRSATKRIEGQLELQQDILDDLVNKVDEINLPSGDGFTTFES